MEFIDFLTIAVFAFSLVMVLAGIFTAYFGTGKSRKVGFILLVVGLVVGVVWIYLVGYTDIDFFDCRDVVQVAVNAIVNFLGIMIGALIAIAIFLIAVMKS